MPVENFVPTLVTTETPSLGGAYATGLDITPASNVLVEDGATGDISFGSGGDQSKAILLYGMVTESGGIPIATRINSTATINAVRVEAKASYSGAVSSNVIRAWLKKLSGASTTSGSVLNGLLSGTLSWVSITNGTIFGSVVLTDIRTVAFGAYFEFDAIATGSGSLSLDALRVVIDYTNGAESTARPRRQLTRLPDGRLAAVRARIR